jgi:hypothetical protein
MRIVLTLIGLLAAIAPVQATGQAAGADGQRDDVVVQGTRSGRSDWREAETSHLILVGDGGEKELARLARNVERLHFLLSGLMGRTDAADATAKLRVTLIGDVATFEAMDLRNSRWQQGPFNDAFAVSRYYDPRDTGAVMATTRVDQRITLERTTATSERVLGVLQGLNLPSTGGASAPGGMVGPTPADVAALQGALIGNFATAGMRGPHDLTVGAGDGSGTVEVTAESLLYAGYAQHYLLTYFPAAYPRWYLDGFGQIFASMVVRGDNVIEFGRSPRGTSAVLSEFGVFPLGDVLDDRYLSQSPGKTHWTPVHAWLLTHFLFFSDTRRPQLRRYLALRANGADAATAAAVFGDQQQLARELRQYFGARKPFEKITYPADRSEQPAIRRLSEGDAAFVQGRLELGGRVLLPADAPPGIDSAVARRIRSRLDDAVKARDRWLARLHRDAERWPREAGAQLLLAEAECRSNHAESCLAAATRAATLAPRDARPLAWKGLAMAQAGVAGPVETREAALLAARRVIVAANRLDNDAIEPLLAYHASYAIAGAQAPVSAIDGLQKAMLEVPASPATRLELGTALVARGAFDPARQVLLPIAQGPYDSPERARAQALLQRLPGH